MNLSTLIHNRGQGLENKLFIRKLLRSMFCIFLSTMLHKLEYTLFYKIALLSSTKILKLS